MHTDEITDETGTEPAADDQPQQLTPPAPEPDHEPGPDRPASNLATARPRNTRGQYMVLAAKVTESQPLRFRELGYTKATGPERAKEIAANDPVHGPKLRRDAEDSGIVLRAVPALYWPKGETTKVEVQKRLVLR